MVILSYAEHPMTPYDCIAKGRASTLTERSASHQHFPDLCELLDEPVAGHGVRRPGRLSNCRLVQRRAVRRRHRSAAEDADIETVLAASKLD